MSVFGLSASAAAAAVSLLLAAACTRGGSKSGDEPTDTAATASGTSSPDAAQSGSAGATPLRPPTDYVGLQYDSLPAGFKYEGGSVIPRGTSGVDADYDFSHIMTPRGDMIWLDTIGAPTAKGLPARIVRAELTIPPLAHDERLFLASCDVNGKFDSRVAAIVVDEPNVTKYTKIRQAWRVNPQSGRFDVIPVTGVTCEEPGG